MIIFGGRNDVVAQWITKEFILKYSGLFKEAVIGPAEYAIVIKDGRIEEILTQEKLTKLGGVWQRILRRLGGGEDLQLLIVDTRPNKVSIPFDGYSSDRVHIAGKIEFTLRISPENGIRVINLMKGTTIPDEKWRIRGWVWKRGRYEKDVMMKELTWADIANRLGSDVKTLLNVNVISQNKAKDFHEKLGDIMLLINETINSLRIYWKEYGIEIITFNVEFNKNAYEEVMRKTIEAEIAQKERDIEFFKRVGDLKTATELEKEKMRLEHQIETLEVFNKYDLEKEIVQHEIELQKIVKDFERDLELGDTQHALSLVELEQKIRRIKTEGETERIKIMAEAEEYLKRMRMKLEDEAKRKEIDRKNEELKGKVDILDKIVGIKGKKVEQEIKYGEKVEIPKKKIEAEAEVKKTEAKAKAEEAAHSLKVYKEAQQIEKNFALEKDEKEIKKIEAITGGGRRQQEDTIKCPHCGNYIPSNSIYCPYCRGKIRGGADNQ